jgi:hypothetical protein
LFFWKCLITRRETKLALHFRQYDDGLETGRAFRASKRQRRPRRYELPFGHSSWIYDMRENVLKKLGIQLEY